MDLEKVARGVALMLEGLGIETPEVRETPRRVAEAMPLVLPGLFASPPQPETVDGPNGPVALRQIPFYAMCEHHLLPFFGTADIVYVPRDGRVAGVSAIAEVVSYFAGRLTLQERLTMELADHLVAWLSPKAVKVRLTARHLCMEMRERAMRGAELVTEAARGEEGILPW